MRTYPLKRFLDIVGALFGLLLFSIPMLVIAVLVRVFLGGPVLFRQERPGAGGKPFNMMKFRSMSNARDAEGNLLPDEVRLGRFGRLLRATSLDELPEFFNVLKGEMSLVGPRPLLMRYLPLYTPEQYRRHEARPGITGWAQVNGRNTISWEQKFEMDVWYVDHMSLLLDLRVLGLTLGKVVRRSGITGEGQATMTEFTGSRQIPER